jgi:uncharacterized membrane protein YgcG
MTRMPRLQRWALRPLLAAIFALTALVAWASPALAGISVTVEPIRGTPQTISTDEVVEPDISGSYDIRDSEGSVDSVEVIDGIAISDLLDAADISTDYRTVEITRPNGRKLVLSRDQIDHPTPPAVVHTDTAGVTWLLRLLPGTDKLYARDRFTGSETLVLKTLTRSPIKVDVSASSKEVEAGESVTFEVSASGALPGADYVFHWDFRDGSDGKRSRKLEVPHKFEKAGRYPVLVWASTDSETSEPAEFEVTVGEPEETEEAGGGGTTTGGADSGTPGGSSGGGATSGGGTSGYTPSYSPSYTPPTPAPYTPAPAPAPPPPTSSKPAPAPGIATDGSFVEGNLLADAGDPPSANILESAARAAREGTPRDDDESGGGIPELALSVAGVLALLGLGAALELRQGPTLRLRRG